MATSREVERKYEVPVGFEPPDLTSVSGVASVDDPVEHDLDATYYDTEGLRLAARGVTLRRRTGGHDEGWHLKRPAGGGDRTETHAPLRRGEPDLAVPDELAAEVRALTRGEPMRPVARLRTRRLERALRDRRGNVLALLADDVVSSEAPGDPALLDQWREVEIELIEGPRKLLKRVEEALRAAGATPARTQSKLARALGDRHPAAARPAPTEYTKAGRLLADYLRAQRDALTTYEPGVRAGDAAAVHDMRVATRRLRSTLRTFRPLLDAERTEPLRAELSWFGHVLGAVRDGDVLADRLAAAVGEQPPELVVGPVAADVRGRLAARTGEARRELAAALDSPRYTALLDAVDAAVDSPEVAAAPTAEVRRRVRKALRRADQLLAAATDADADGVPAALRLPGSDDRDSRLHAARRTYKRARYAVEAVAPLAAGPAGELVGRLKDLQDVLGTHQDTVVARELLREYAMRTHAEGGNAFTYGVLHAGQRQAGERVLADLPKARRRAGRPRVRRWLER
jgi:CHAD domain-containing protein